VKHYNKLHIRRIELLTAPGMFVWGLFRGRTYRRPFFMSRQLEQILNHVTLLYTLELESRK